MEGKKNRLILLVIPARHNQNWVWVAGLPPLTSLWKLAMALVRKKPYVGLSNQGMLRLTRRLSPRCCRYFSRELTHAPHISHPARAGATCYLNSFIQTLYMTPEFRAAVFAFEYDPSRDGKRENCALLQLQRLFAHLQLGLADTHSTTDLTRSFGWESADVFQVRSTACVCAGSVSLQDHLSLLSLRHRCHRCHARQMPFNNEQQTNQHNTNLVHPQQQDVQEFIQQLFESIMKFFPDSEAAKVGRLNVLARRATHTPCSLFCVSDAAP